VGPGELSDIVAPPAEEPRERRYARLVLEVIAQNQAFPDRRFNVALAALELDRTRIHLMLDLLYMEHDGLIVRDSVLGWVPSEEIA
jgi:hypothetical protein